MNTPVVTLKTNHPLCVRPLLSVSSARSNAKRHRDRRERFPAKRLFSNLCCRNSSLQASRLTSPKLDERPHLTNHFGKNVNVWEKLVKEGTTSFRNQPCRGPPSADHLPRARGTLSAYAQPLPMSASCRPCHNCPKLTVAPPRPQRLPREGDPADQETEHGAGSDRIERCAPYRSPR